MNSPFAVNFWILWLVKLAYVDMAAGIGGNTHGRRKFYFLTTMSSPRKEELAFWSECLHAVQFEVRNIDVSLGSDGDIQRLLELAGFASALSEGTQKLAGRGKHLHAAGAGVGDKTPRLRLLTAMPCGSSNFWAPVPAPSHSAATL